MIRAPRFGRRGRIATLSVVLAAATLLGSACSQHRIISLPEPPTTVATTTTAPLPDFSTAVLAKVPGKTTTTIPLGPGAAGIKGTVVGPDGPAEGAVVHLERFVGSASSSADVVTQADGSFAAPNILGGRWRVRAWKAPDQSLTEPAVFYLAAADQKQLSLVLTRFTGVHATFAIAPDPPEVDQPANLVVEVTTQQVDGQGVVRATPVVGAAVELFGSNQWTIKGSSSQTTDFSGRATWRLTCGSSGKQQLSVVVNSTNSFPLNISACVEPPPDTTAPSSTTSSSVKSTTTTTA